MLRYVNWQLFDFQFILQWKQKILNLMTLSSLIAPWIVIIITHRAISNDKFIKFTIFISLCVNIVFDAAHIWRARHLL